MPEEKWWYAIDNHGTIHRKSTNKTLLDQIAKLKGWTVTDKLPKTT